MITTASPVELSTSPDEVEAAVDLQRAEPERGRAAEHRGEDREDVDRLADRAVDAIAEQRIEDRADQVRHALAEAEVAQREPDDRVQRPRLQRPVEVRPLHRDGRRLLGVRLRQAERRRGQVRDRLGDAEEHQPDSHPGAEHHRDPRDRLELRTVIVLAESQPPVGTQRQERDEDQESRRREHEQPAEVREQPAQDVPDHGRHVVLEEHADQYERHRDRGGDGEDRRVDRPALIVLHFPLLSSLTARLRASSPSSSSPGGTRRKPTIRSTTMFWKRCTGSSKR